MKWRFLCFFDEDCAILPYCKFQGPLQVSCTLNPFFLDDVNLLIYVNKQWPFQSKGYTSPLSLQYFLLEVSMSFVAIPLKDHCIAQQIIQSSEKLSSFLPLWKPYHKALFIFSWEKLLLSLYKGFCNVWSCNEWNLSVRVLLYYGLYYGTMVLELQNNIYCTKRECNLPLDAADK